ncbi:MAG: glycosyltransferase family 4 protein [Candidatus Moranbacteria bacterium]|nr:glycosyltransferase family 4 protein [Candidatus Moranbacteria bacterium]
MRIGIDASFLRKPGTGIGQVTANFLQKLAESTVNSQQSTDCRYVLYCEEAPALRFGLPENFEVKAFLPKWWKRDDVPRRTLWERELSKRAQEDGCDVFLSLSQSSVIFKKSKIKNQKSSIRHVMVVHDIIPRLFPKYLGTFTRKLHWKAVEKGIRSADRIIAVSEKTRADLVSELGIPEEKIAVAFPDCDPSFRVGATSDDILRVMKKYALEPGYIYHGGGLEIRKNAERLLHAYAALHTKRQEARDKRQGAEGSEEQKNNVPPLVISGKVFPASNTLATDVRGIVRKLGLEESVVVLGFVPDEDLPALYHGASFFTYPSLYEGFGLPVLEAFSCGTSVLAGRAGSVPELAGDAALLVDPESEEAILHGMERLLDDDALREDLSKKGRVRAQDFSWDAFTGKVVDCLIAEESS